MGVEKDSSILEYSFTEFSRDKINSVHPDEQSHNELNIDQNLQVSENSFSNLVEEVDVANEAGFVIDEQVFDLRQHRNAKKNEFEQKIEERLQSDLEKIRDRAYQDGFEKGLSDGVMQSRQEEKEASERKMQEFRGMVDNLLKREEDIIKLQNKELSLLIRDFVKWITLKDLEKDDEYIIRLISRIVEENKKASRIIFQVGIGVVASFKDSIEELNKKLKSQYNEKVEVVENPNIDKDAIEVEIGNNILKADIFQQIKVFDQIFQSIGE